MPGTSNDYHDAVDRSATYPAAHDDSAHGHSLSGPGDSFSNSTAGSGVLSSSIGSYMPPYPNFSSSSSPPTSAYDPTAQGGQNYGSSSDVNAHHTGGALTTSESESAHYNGATEFASPPGATGEYEDEYEGPEMMDDPRGLAEEYVEPLPEQDNYVEDVVQPGFDEAILRALCDMDVGVPLLLDRIKQSITSCREAQVFLKKRAVLEDEYGKGLQKLARQTSEVYAMSDGKAGTFVGAWHSSMKIHEIIGDNRVKFAARLNEMSEELAMLIKEVDKNRKGTKDLASRYERSLQESEAALEKIRTRHDSTADELQRFLLSKEGESTTAGMSNPGNTGKSSGGKNRLIGKTVAKGGMLLKGKNPANQQRQEEDIRARMSSAAEAFRKAVQETQTMRQEYFNFQLPRILRALKECADEIDLGMQYHLQRYAFLMESTALNDGTTITPAGTDGNSGPGIKDIMKGIDNQGDFRVFMQNYAVSHAPKGPRREGPWEEGFLPPLPNHNSVPERGLAYESQSSIQSPVSVSGHGHRAQTSLVGTPTSPSAPSSENMTANPSQASLPTSHPQHYVPSPSHPAYPSNPSYNSNTSNASNTSRTSRSQGPTFGIYLADQMARDNVEVPKVVEKCCVAIRESGALENVGIYRISGITSKVQKLKGLLDRDVDAVDLSAPEWTSDINTITSTLKLWFRELPEPLLTYSLYSGFIEAARNDNERLRHIRLHERVNELPDPNYATLKYLMGHLYEVSERSHLNQMHASNLAIVFGPTLLGAPTPNRNASISTHGNGSESTGGGQLQDMSLQCKAIETILEHYRDIFVDEPEDA